MMNKSNSRILAGAMSGTSADGVDVALVQISGRGLEMKAQILLGHHREYPASLKKAICDIRAKGEASLDQLAEVGREISLCYAAAVNEALLMANLNADALAAVAAHGQTLFHDPPRTIQWLDPALLAREVGACVISDFRRADCAAGGQGAPLVPFADFLLFRDPKKNRAMLNLGGIANITFLPAGCSIEHVLAFDTGPANCISDFLCRRHDPHGAGFDPSGSIAASGKVIDSILQGALSNVYFGKKPPKSTDGPQMIAIFTHAQQQSKGDHKFEDLLQTACALSAQTVTQAIKENCKPLPDELIASGGGTRNATLMNLLRNSLNIPVRNIYDFGVESSSKEAMAFALLGAATLDGVPSNIPSATGAEVAVVLGSITPKPHG